MRFTLVFPAPRMDMMPSAASRLVASMNPTFWSFLATERIFLPK